MGNGYGSIERGDTDVQLSRLEKIANTFEISLLQLFNLNEKSIFNQTNNTSESNVQSQYYWNDSPKDKQQLEHELEKMLLLNTQQEIGHLTNEIIYLKEIIELMKNKNGSLDS